MVADKNKEEVESGIAESHSDDLVENLKDAQKESAPEQVENFDPHAVKKIRRKVDFRLLPILTIMYAVSLMDRTNMGNLAIAGMRKDLNILTGLGYNICNLCFFITYIVFQPLLVLACRKIGPRWFLPIVCLIWGFVLIGGGYIKHWHELLGFRLVLGFLEAGYFPSCLYLISTWYTRFDLAKRLSLFFLVGSFLASLTNILAYGFMQMEGLQGHAAWRWILIMEGVLTLAIALIGTALIVKFPDEELSKPSIKFLREDEVKVVMARINADRADADLEDFSWKKFLGPSTELWVYAFPAILCLVTTVVNAFSFTLPIILMDSFGFSVAEAQCLTTPPYALALLVGYAASWISDRYRTRGPILIALALVCITGLGIIGWAEKPAVRYFGVFITLAGANSSISATTAYQATNIRGQWRRAFCSSMLTGLGGFGGIIGALVFRAQDRPEYIPGYITCIVASVLVIIIVVLESLYFHRCNKQADRGERIIMDDPNFRYTI